MLRSVLASARRSALLAGSLLAVIATTAVSTGSASTTDGAGIEDSADRARASAVAVRHTRLLRSIPAADSVIKGSPATIQLWFSEKIELGLSRVRIVDAAGTSVSITPLTQDATNAGAPVVGRVPAPLADGKYTLHWTAASGDGHAVRGTFVFTIKSR